MPYPRRNALQDLAATELREHPTIPPTAEPAAADHGELWPRVFCAFKGCMWEERFGTEEDLEDHLREEHLEALEPICQHMLRKDAPDALRSAYSEAIAVKCRTQAPIAGPSLDRAALNSFAEAMTGNKTEALICWCCGNIHPLRGGSEEQRAHPMVPAVGAQRVHGRVALSAAAGEGDREAPRPTGLFIQVQPRRAEASQAHRP